MTPAEQRAREIYEWVFDEEGNMLVTIEEFRTHIATALQKFGEAEYRRGLQEPCWNCGIRKDHTGQTRSIVKGKYIVKTSEPHPWMWGIYYSEGSSCQPYEEFSNILEANRRAAEMNKPTQDGE